MCAAVSFAAAADWLGTFALHSTCALGSALVLGLALQNRALAWQERWMRFSLWAALVSSTVQFATVGSPLSLALPETPAALPATPVPAAAMVASQAGLAEVPGSLPSPAVGAGMFPWAATVVGAAAFAAVLGLAWLWRAQRRLSRVLAARQPELDARVLATAAAVATELGMRQSPHLSRSELLATPIAFGWLRPEICLPSRVGDLAQGSLRAMLAHEIAHLRRGDPAWMWLTASVQALFPWQPLLAVVRRRWARLVELRCDAIAAHHSSPTAVARCLLDVAEWLRPGASDPVVALGMAARPSALRERIEAALRPGSPRPPRHLLSATVGCLSLSALTLGAPGVQSTHGDAMAGVVAESRPDAVDPVDASRAPSAALLAAADLLQREHADLQAEVAHMRQGLQGRRSSPELEQLLSTLARRLLTLERSRARLQAVLDRRGPQAR